VLSDGTANNQVAFIPYQAPKPLPLTGTSWTLETFEETQGTGEAATVSGTPVLNNAPITLQIKDDQASGSAGCNRYTGQVTLGEGKLSFGPMALTRKACSEEVNRQEQRYAKALASVARYEIAGERLWLSDADGKFTLHFSGKPGE